MLQLTQGRLKHSRYVKIEFLAWVPSPPLLSSSSLLPPSFSLLLSPLHLPCPPLLLLYFFTCVFSYLRLSAERALRPTHFAMMKQLSIIQKLYTRPHLYGPCQNSVLKRARLIHFTCGLFLLGEPLSILLVSFSSLMPPSVDCEKQ